MSSELTTLCARNEWTATLALCWLDLMPDPRSSIRRSSGGSPRSSSGAAEPGTSSPMPMTEVCNQIVQLDNLWGRDGRLLRERLLEAPTPGLKFRVFEEVLLQHLTLKYDAPIQHAIAALKAGIPTSRVASSLGLLPRTLVRRFSTEVGITPKRFARVHRLQRVLRAVRGSSEPD